MEAEGSPPPPPQDSYPDAGEAINDIWSMSRNFIYRHHVEPRVKLYSPREESFPIPLKYIDVSRTRRTNLDVKQEKRIDDYWNIFGSRDLSDPWTGFTQFTLLEEKPPNGYMWFGPVIPFGAMVEYHPFSAKDQSRLHQFAQKSCQVHFSAMHYTGRESEKETL